MSVMFLYLTTINGVWDVLDKSANFVEKESKMDKNNTINQPLTVERYIQEIEKIRRCINKQPLCNCMHPGCSDKPIYSHVFQKNGVLDGISNTNRKVMMFTYDPLFAILKGNTPLSYKETGLNEVFGFYGFCPSHDTTIFAPIELQKGVVDWYDPYNLYLLGYRTLCREYYIQLLTQNFFTLYSKTFILPDEYELNTFLCQANLRKSISVFLQYKSLFEEGISNQDFSKYTFKTLYLPFRLELCVASPITITEECRLYFGPEKDKITDTVNIVEIFPEKDATIVIIGFLNDAENVWASDILQMFSNGSVDDICSALQDILFRSEFHCMSENLYYQIRDKIPMFLNEWMSLRDKFDSQLDFTSNIFGEVIKKYLGYGPED